MGTGPASEPTADVEQPLRRQSLRQRRPTARVAAELRAGGFHVSEHALRRILAWAGAKVVGDAPGDYSTERRGNARIATDNERCARCHRRLQTVVTVRGTAYGRTCAKREGERDA